MEELEEFFNAPIESLSFLRKKEIRILESSFSNVEEMLRWIPKRHEDRSSFDSFPQKWSETPLCLRGKVIDTQKRYFGRKGFYQVVIQEGGDGIFSQERITCRWFNLHYIHKMLMVNREVIIYGKIKELQGKCIMEHPEFEITDGEENPQSIHLGRIVPIYRTFSGIPQRRFREIFWQLIEELQKKKKSLRLGLGEDWDLTQIFSSIHFPKNKEEIDSLKRKLALEEFFVIQVGMLQRKKSFSHGKKRIAQGKLIQSFLQKLPFQLTNSQKECISEIRKDLESPQVMNRLLQGDVGSGKTLIALIAALHTVEAGYQVALMVPTQILAEQHYRNFKQLLEPFGIRISLQVSGKKETSFLEFSGDSQIVVGTHALLYGSSEWKNLGLVIIDEQHKFGVDQRANLVKQGILTDILMMTATPIPRTLAMTIYGDMEVSYLRESPAGRGEIITALRCKPSQRKVAKFLKQEIQKGRQGYIIYPLVEESEKLKVHSAKEEYPKWKKLLPEIEIALLHGKLSPEKKEKITRLFAQGEISLLVSTTVVEVGVDVPNANTLLIYDCDRFGLAQIHQLRGRVGRGKEKSYCILVSRSQELLDSEKMQILKKTRDGFEIAEADLKLRGPGDILGTEQSGISALRFAYFLADIHLISEAKSLAEKAHQATSDFKEKEYAWIRRHLSTRKDILSFS